MIIRNGTYTFLNRIEMLLQEYYGHGITNPEIDNHRILSYSKEFGLIDGFKLDDKTHSYFKDIKLNELTNAFKLTTKARYKNEKFTISGFNKERNILGLLTNNEKLANELGFIKLTDHYIKEISPNDLDEIWEERTISNLNLS